MDEKESRPHTNPVPRICFIRRYEHVFFYDIMMRYLLFRLLELIVHTLGKASLGIGIPGNICTLKGRHAIDGKLDIYVFGVFFAA